VPARARPTPASDLRDRLLAAAVKLIGTRGPQGFSLREVARRAAVSEAAPYHHFANREALLAAVAEQGFAELAAAMAATWARHADPLARLQALGVDYVRFALRRPSSLRVMFGAEIPDKSRHPGLERISRHTFGLLVYAIADCQAAGRVVAGDTEELAIAAWAIVHGLSELFIDHKLQAHAGSPAQVDALTRRVTEILLHGLATAPPARVSRAAPSRRTGRQRLRSVSPSRGQR
jgi:AcrR family transcriptional regulator